MEKKSFRYQVVHHWNNIWNDVFEAGNLSQFGNKF